MKLEITNPNDFKKSLNAFLDKTKSDIEECKNLIVRYDDLPDVARHIKTLKSQEGILLKGKNKIIELLELQIFDNEIKARRDVRLNLNSQAEKIKEEYKQGCIDDFINKANELINNTNTTENYNLSDIANNAIKGKSKNFENILNVELEVLKKELEHTAYKLSCFDWFASEVNKILYEFDTFEIYDPIKIANGIYNQPPENLRIALENELKIIEGVIKRNSEEYKKSCVNWFVEEGNKIIKNLEIKASLFDKATNTVKNINKDIKNKLAIELEILKRDNPAEPPAVVDEPTEVNPSTVIEPPAVVEPTAEINPLLYNHKLTLSVMGDYETLKRLGQDLRGVLNKYNNIEIIKNSIKNEKEH